MSLSHQILNTYTEVNEDEATELREGTPEKYTVAVKPPKNKSLPATLGQLVRGLTEIQSSFFGVKNASPTAAFEIRRDIPDSLRFQFTLPTKRLERKLRTHLATEIPDIGFGSGADGLPVKEGDTVGGGILTLGRLDRYPLRTEFDTPPTNSVASALHRHAMQDTRVVIQVLFRPVAGKPLRRWYWKRRAYQRIGYLRKEKEKLWGNRPPTPRERKQADAVEEKAGTRRFHTSIRFFIAGAGKYTPSRVKELAGGFNVYESGETGQYFDAVTITTLREKRLLNFSDTVAKRRFGYWNRSFQASRNELAGLIALPDLTQENINYSKP
ncbi:hypothetical protein GRX03_12285 [Halovenus sp. WSH3]|uniref:DUF8128 domain-containing protein n=1 Tax=Halovenus carboxidivorans TaxID=2692199 RepID=A0A6B0T2B2_9EURY|nr:hypothetical protein [Halovenus carboxidivorans]MXR52378.1 hypothetical protein [Halovenus carboxidivorans]